MKNVYFLRHGQTNLNRQHLHQYAETGLSEKGRLQAQTIAKKLKDIKIDVIISSSLARTKETADIVAQEVGLPVEVNDLFVELRRPSDLWGTSWYSPKSIWIMGNLYFRVYDKDWHYSNEENLEEFHERAKQALNYIAGRSEENILVVTHRGLMANMDSKIRRDGLDSIAQFRRALWKNFKMGNCCVLPTTWSPEGEWGDTLNGTWTLNGDMLCPEL